MSNLYSVASYVIFMVVALVFVIVLLSRQERTGKEVAIWLISGLVGVMLGIAGTVGAVNFTGHQLIKQKPITIPDQEQGGGGGGGGGEAKKKGGSRAERSGKRNFDPAAMFAERDADEDGKLTADEIPERMSENLSRIDTDGDGALTLDELQASLERRADADADAEEQSEENSETE